MAAKSEVKVTYNSDSSADSEDIGDELDESIGAKDNNDPNNDETEDIQPGEGQSGWASVLSSILNKKPQEDDVILAKGATDKELFRKRKLKDLEGTEGTTEGKILINERRRERLQKKKKVVWEEMGRIKPDLLDKEKEKRLQRIATKGVVQLFNAVRKQQKIVDDKLKSIGGSEFKKEKVLKSLPKGEFLDMLKDKPTTDTNTQQKTNPKVEEEDRKPIWGVLRDDFMMGSEMKDWDQRDSGSEDNNDKVLDDSDSDNT